MILAILLLLSGLTISAVAIYYSVVGLVAIFSAAAIPIMVMGISLEVGKLVIASWVKARWTQAPFLMKSYAIIAVIILMVITSLGIFGFLSKAHSDQTLVSGDVQSKIAVYDEKIKTSRDNIDANRKALKQMDEAVDQVMGRSSDEKGADKAVQIRRAQQKERARLLAEITAEQKTITTISEERAPIAAEVRKVEAEVGPLKYIAAFIYGENPDANLLEKAVTWVIILIVIVFDPLAIVMLLAAQMTFGWIKEEKEAKLKYEQDDGPLNEEALAALRERAKEDLPTGELTTKDELFPIDEDVVKELDDPINCHICNTPLVEAPGIGLFCPNKECDVADGPFDDSEPAKIVIHWPEVENKVKEPAVSYTIVDEDHEPDYPEPIITPKEDDSESVGFLKKHTMTIREQIEEPEVKKDDTPNFEGFKDLTTGEWVQTGPAFEPVKEEPVKEELVDVIDTSHPFAAVSGDYVEYEGKRMHKRVLADLRPDLGIAVDNPTQPEVSFGDNFPKNPSLGDMFTRVDVIPHRIFKFNGRKWIEVSRENTDSHLSENGYIQHLIEKIASGEYDPDHLTPAEQDAIAQFIKEDKNTI
jgi:hypothetical protein